VLYGASPDGGQTQPNAEGYGVVFSLTPPSSPDGDWTEAALFSFGSGGDGQWPEAGVTIGPGGVLYGTTTYGGKTACPSGCGTAFSLTPPPAPGGAWTETVLAEFTGKKGDGEYPNAGLTIGPGGVLYGVTTGSGKTKGTVYALTP
jgi:hypothetical protein